MVIIDQLDTSSNFTANTALALGYFDGVHLGHQAVIKKAKAYAKAHNLALGVFTYKQSPQNVIKGPALTSLKQKHNILASLGVDYCFEPDFNTFKDLSAEAFFNTVLLQNYHSKAIFCGKNFGFGAKRSGNIDTLKKMCAEDHVFLDIVPTSIWEGLPVSSSRIRVALANGDIPAVNAMLGRPYAVLLPVEHGQHLGTQLGFPTINQTFSADMQEPRYGTYITQTLLNGKEWPSSTGFGPRPTVEDSGKVTCETFIPYFSGDLYGKEVQVSFYEHIADTQKFDSLEDLTTAVNAWAQQALDYFKNKN